MLWLRRKTNIYKISLDNQNCNQVVGYIEIRNRGDTFILLSIHKRHIGTVRVKDNGVLDIEYNSKEKCPYRLVNLSSSDENPL